MVAPVLIVPAIVPVLSLEQAKLQARIDDSDADQLIVGYIESATAHIERILSMALVTQTWRQDFAGFANRLSLSFRPVDPQSIVIKYQDSDDAEQTLDAEEYEFFLGETCLPYVAAVSSWPATATRPDAVSITFNVGVAPDSVPRPLRHAVSLLVSHWYNNREAAMEGTATDIPFGVDRLIAPYRLMTV